jgi:hypothetical protein
MVVIDHLDIAEAPPPRDVDELIVPSLALQVALSLCLGGLTRVDHCLALQHRGGGSELVIVILLRRDAEPPITGWRVGQAPSCAPRDLSHEAFWNRMAC